MFPAAISSSDTVVEQGGHVTTARGAQSASWSWTWTLGFLGAAYLLGYCQRRRPPARVTYRNVQVQSQTTYTSVRGAEQPRFYPVYNYMGEVVSEEPFTRQQ